MSESNETIRSWRARWTARRWVIVSATLILALVALATWRRGDTRARVQATLALAAGHSLAMTVYKSPACECCKKWIALLRTEGFTVDVVEQEELAAVKTRLGVPSAAVSCHTAMIDGYVVEGHVPTEDILRLLRERPAVVGIAVPGMPTGAPGMDGPKVPYTVVSFDRSGALATFAAR
jgi:hypothetical protein